MRDAEDPVEAEFVEPVAHERARALGRKAPAPRRVSQPVADLDLRRARDVLEREPADEIAVVAARRAPRPETRVEPVRARNAPQRIVDLLARRSATAADVAHDARIGVELVKLV